MLIGGLLGTSRPEKASPIVAGTDIKRPNAAAVPTALCIGTEKDTKDGTPIVPAPTPIRDEIKPIKLEKRKFMNLETGNFLLTVKEFFLNIFIATKKATEPNISFNSFTPKYFPIKPPIKAPKNIPKPHFFNIFKSIEPFK